MTSLFRFRTLLFSALFTLLLVGCQNYGTKLTFKKGEVYYTDQVTEAEGQKLGNYLLQAAYFDDQKEKSVQLTKASGTYQVRMVVDQDTVNAHSEYVELFSQLTDSLSASVFANAPVEIHLCDESLKTFKTIPYRKPVAAAAKMFDPATLGTRIDVGGDAFYYSAAVDRPTAEKTAEYLKKDGLFKGTGRVAQLDHTGDGWQLHVIFNEGTENDPTVIENMKRKSKQLSGDLFAGAPVAIHLADDAMQTRKQISSVD